MRAITMFLAVILVMTVQNMRAEGRNPTDSRTVPQAKVVVAITSNRWTAEKVLIATGTLTNTAAVPIRVTQIIAAGFDKDQKPVVDDSDPGEAAHYTIGESEIAPGATVIFKVALSDPKRHIRFVTATPAVEVIPPPTPTPTPTPDPAILAGPMPEVQGLWGVSLPVHNAIKEKLNDPDSYKYISAYEPSVSEFGGEPCWLVIVSFRSKNGFGGYVFGTAGVYMKIGPGKTENILGVFVALQ